MAPGSIAPSSGYFVRSVSALSILAIPMLLSFFTLYAALCGLKVYDEFVEGAKEGFGVILKIIPFLVTMLVAIGMFKGAGGIDLLARALSPILTPLHFPTDLLPIALMRPLSGHAHPFYRCRASTRAGKHRQPDGGDDLREHGDYLLRRRRLFRLGRDQANAARPSGRFAGGFHRGGGVGDYLSGGIGGVKSESIIPTI